MYTEGVPLSAESGGDGSAGRCYYAAEACGCFTALEAALCELVGLLRNNVCPPRFRTKDKPRCVVYHMMFWTLVIK